MVVPLFRCLARAVDRDGGRGVEIASRLGYDDVNECFCRRDVVHQACFVSLACADCFGNLWLPRRYLRTGADKLLMTPAVQNRRACLQGKAAVRFCFKSRCVIGDELDAEDRLKPPKNTNVLPATGR